MKTVFVALASALLLAPAAGSAQDASSYPSRPIRVVSPYDAGGQSDVIMRAIGQKLTERWGQPILIENRPGAGGNIGTESAARAAPDGHTLLLAEGAVMTINPHVYRNIPFDPFRDFAPVTQLNWWASVIVVHPSVPANSLKELIALAKAKPGALTYGSFGIGSGAHLNMEAFKQLLGLDILHVPFKGSAPVVTELSAGRLSIAAFAIFSALSPVKAGKWRALGYASPKRSPLLPDVPTFAEEGVPNFGMTSWFGVWGPAGMPRPLAVKFQQEVSKIIHEPAFTAEWFTSRGLEPVGGTPEELTAITRADTARWAKVVKAAGIKVE